MATKTKSLIFSLIFSIIILSLLVNTESSFTFGLRNLLEEEKFNKICENTVNKFKGKYNAMKDLETQNVESLDKLDKYQEVLKEMIQSKKIKKINKYLPRILTYLIVAIIGVIFIIFWISFCCLSCKEEKWKKKVGCGTKCSFIIFFVLSIGVIFFCVIGLLYFPYLNKTLNGVSCSIYKFVFHFLNGTNDDYIDSKWAGLDEIYNNLTECYNDERSSSLEKVETIQKTFEKINNKTLEDIECFMETWDKYYPYSSIIIFGGVLIFNFLSLICLFSYFACNCECICCLFHLFWNLEIIFIIATFLLSSVLGSLSIVSKDVSEIFTYQKQYINDTEDKFIFDFSEGAEEIDECLNGDGDLFHLIFENRDEEERYYNFINKEYEPYEDKSLLIESFNCSLFKNDYNIFVDELKTSLSKKLYFVSLILIIIGAAGIVSISFGILVYNDKKECYPTKSQEINIHNNNPMMNNRIDISTENLKKQNNEIIFPKNIK